MPRFFESGYGSSKQAGGHHKVFRTCLEEVYMDYKGKCRIGTKLQNELAVFQTAKSAYVNALKAELEKSAE